MIKCKEGPECIIRYFLINGLIGFSNCVYVSVCLCVDSAGQTPRKVRHHYTGEMTDVYCSQCSKKVNLLNDLDARLKNLKANR